MRTDNIEQVIHFFGAMCHELPMGGAGVSILLKAKEELAALKTVEVQKPSTNSAMPKLPTFMEMFQMFMASQSLISGNDSVRMLKGFTEFVERQLSA